MCSTALIAKVLKSAGFAKSTIEGRSAGSDIWTPGFHVFVKSCIHPGAAVVSWFWGSWKPRPDAGKRHEQAAKIRDALQAALPAEYEVFVDLSDVVVRRKHV